MPNTAVRLYSTGVLSSNGEFDEVSRISTTGLLLYYDGAKSYSRGGNTVYDLSSSNNNGILVGTSTYTTANSGYFIQNGGVGYITSTTQYNNLTEFSIGAWFKTSTTSRASKLIGFSNGFAGSNYLGASDSLPFETNYDRHLYIGSDNKVYFGIYPGQVVTINTTPTYTDNVWHYAVGTFSGSQSSMRLYVDGVLQASNTQFSTAQAYPGRWKIGAGSLGGWPANAQPSVFYDGSLGPATVYNRALPATEVLQNYNLDAARFGRTFSSYTSSKTSLNSLSVAGEFNEVTFNPNAANSAIVNKAVFSENPSGAGWTGYNRTVTPNFTSAPDGSVTASRIIESTDSVNTIHGFGQGQSLYIAGQRYTISFYMKPSSANRAFIFGVGSDVVGGTNQYVYAYCDPDLGTITNSLTYAPAAQTTSVTNAGNGWYRFSLSFLVANTTTSGVDIQFQGGAGKNQQTYIGNGSSVLFWGLQIEQGSTPSIYQGINAASTLITPRFAKRETSDGSLYVTRGYDEFTGILPVTDGLKLYLDSSNYPGTGSTWSDLTNNRNDATFINSNTSFSTDNGGIIKFPGKFGGDAYANTPLSTRAFTPTSEKTLSVWVKFNSTMKSLSDYHPRPSYNYGQVSNSLSQDTYGSTGILLGCNNYGDYGLTWFTYRFGGTTYFGVLSHNRVNGPYQESTLTNDFVYANAFDRWYNITSTYSPPLNSHVLYVNGTAVQSTTTITNGNSFGYSFPTIMVARNGVPGGNGFDCTLDGSIGQAIVYTRALTANEVLQNFNKTRNRFGI